MYLFINIIFFPLRDILKNHGALLSVVFFFFFLTQNPAWRNNSTTASLYMGVTFIKRFLRSLVTFIV